MERPSEFHGILENHGLSLAAVDFRMHTDFDAYKRLFEFMQALDCRIFVCIDPAGTEKDFGKYGSLLNESHQDATLLLQKSNKHPAICLTATACPKGWTSPFGKLP